MHLVFLALLENYYTLTQKGDGNKLAHSLSRHSINVNDYVVWMKDVLPIFFSTVQADIANSYLR